MREIAVVDPGNREHSDEIEQNRNSSSEPAAASPNNAKASEMQNDKWDATNQIYPIGLSPDNFGLLS